MASDLQRIVTTGVVAALQPQLTRLESKIDCLQAELNVLRSQGVAAPASVSAPQVSTQPAFDGPILGHTGVAVAVDEPVPIDPEERCALARRTCCRSSIRRGSNAELGT